MKKFLLSLLIACPLLMNAGNVGFVSAVIPAYIQGTGTATNNNRVPFWFWGDIGGLGPNRTYHYYTVMDTATGLNTNGAGNPYLVNENTRTIRRITNTSLSSNSGYDSLTTDANGRMHGWFGVEPTANLRFTPGNTIYVKIILNDGIGGTTANQFITGASYPITVIGFGTTSMSATQGSALWDSLDATPKNFICAYDNVTATGRPIGIGIVENDSMYLRPILSIAAFYRNRVDSLNFHWGIIVPNNLPNGIRALEERKFMDGSPVDTATDSDGIWCWGTNTVNMSTGNVPTYLNSTYVLSGTYVIPDTTWTGFPTAFTANYTSPNATYSWDYGDASNGSGPNTSHTYNTNGVYNAQLIVSTGGCADTINQTVVVMLTTGMISTMPLSIQVKPNPTNGELLITTKDNNEKTVTVMNTLGETISTQILTGNTVLIDLAGNAKGIYLVRVQDNVTGRVGTKRIVLQ
ncbi:MAG TPA: PKD domain-containing protein [Bacteroidia bacterium]|nr:PKD domain-containing protein [Bacteroidia bacterium]